jgi:hypothetical protein
VVEGAPTNRSDGAPSPQRSAQTLPIPLGGLVPVHRHATALRRRLRQHRSAPMLALTLVAIGGGIWLSISPRTFNAGRDAIGVQVDDLTLTPSANATAGTAVFSGAATLVVVTAPSGLIKGGAVMIWNGLRTTGRCVLLERAGGATETCEFGVGATRLTSSDRYVARTRTWNRRYGDGVDVTISVPSGSMPIPIPFPLGR